MLKPSEFLLPPLCLEAPWLMKSREELVGRGDCTEKTFPPLSPFLINLELTKAGREVAESSLEPPLPQRGSPQLWEGLPPLLLPPPLDTPHQYQQ